MSKYNINYMHIEIDEKNQKINILANNKKPKKITGSRFQALLSPYKDFNNKLEVFANYFGLKPFISAYDLMIGQQMEPIILDRYKKAFPNHTIQTGEELGGKMWNDKLIDNFADDPDFGGIIDARDLTTKTILEVKCVDIKKLEKWKKDGVPLEYTRQTQLYMDLMGYRKGILIVGFVKKPDQEEKNRLFEHHYGTMGTQIPNPEIVAVKMFKVKHNEVLILARKQQAMWARKKLAETTELFYGEKDKTINSYGLGSWIFPQHKKIIEFIKEKGETNND